MDECAESEPCLNGGSCTQTEIPGNYTCACPEEYKVKFMNFNLFLFLKNLCHVFPKKKYWIGKKLNSNFFRRAETAKK